MSIVNAQPSGRVVLVGTDYVRVIERTNVAFILIEGYTIYISSSPGANMRDCKNNGGEIYISFATS